MSVLRREVATPLFLHGVAVDNSVRASLGEGEYRKLLWSGRLRHLPGGLVVDPDQIDLWTPLVEVQLRHPSAVAAGPLSVWLYQVPPYSGRRPPAADWVSRTRSRLAGARTVPDLCPSDVRVIGGIRTLSPARTLVDLGHRDEGVLERVGELMLFRGIVTEPVLEATVTRLGRRGRRGVAALHRFLVRRGHGARPCETDLEVRALQVIRGFGYPEPAHRQFLVPRDRGEPYRVDFAWKVRDRLVFVEIDGSGVHNNPQATEHDLRRQNELFRDGRRTILRFTEADVDLFPRRIDLEMSFHVPQGRRRDATPR